MTDVIIYTNDAGQCVEVNPAPGLDVAFVQSKDVPAGKTSFITDRSNLPSDDIFRDAWEEDGSQVVEDLEKSRTISLDLVRDVAVAAAKDARSKEDINEFTAFTVTQVSDAYNNCKTELQGASTVAALKSCLNTFVSTYSVS